MRLVAPTAFKGTRTPLEAARILAQPGDHLLPLSDGGDGFLECVHLALGGRMEPVATLDAWGDPIEALVLRLADGTVVVESARIIGLGQGLRRDPWTASSLGLGQVLAHVQQAPAVWLGLGGTATMDGGMGWPHLDLSRCRVFCDVRTDLADAARVFGPQKGARPEDLEPLTRRLLQQGLPQGPFTGAAGGLGARLKALGATLIPGAEAILEAVGFDALALAASLVLTGEGRLDASTGEGKLPGVVAQRARALGRRVEGHFGCRGPGWETVAPWFDAIHVEQEEA